MKINPDFKKTIIFAANVGGKILKDNFKGLLVSTFVVYIIPVVIKPIITRAKKIVPELKGSPKELTKSNSVFAKRFTISGIIPYIIKTSKRIETIPVLIIPLILSLYFLK